MEKKERQLCEVLIQLYHYSELDDMVKLQVCANYTGDWMFKPTDEQMNVIESRDYFKNGNIYDRHDY